MVTKTKNHDDNDESDDDDAREVWFDCGGAGNMFDLGLFLEDYVGVMATVYTLDDFVVWRAESVIFDTRKKDAKAGLCFHRKLNKSEIVSLS